jgi:hypothetical protein
MEAVNSSESSVNIYETKAKAVPLHAMKALGVRGIQLLILDLGTRWGKWSASRPGRALALGKGPPVPTVQKAGWAPEDTEAREKSFLLCRGSNLDRPVIQPVARHYTD